jgi:hypothetical protein
LSKTGLKIYYFCQHSKKDWKLFPGKRVLKNKFFEVIFSINKDKKWICFGHILGNFSKSNWQEILKLG